MMKYENNALHVETQISRRKCFIVKRRKHLKKKDAGKLKRETSNSKALLPFPKFHFQYKIIRKLISVCSLTQTRCILFKPMTSISSLCYALFRLYSNWKTSKTYAMHTLDGPQWFNKIGISFYLSIGFIPQYL